MLHDLQRAYDIVFFISIKNAIARVGVGKAICGISNNDNFKYECNGAHLMPLQGREKCLKGSRWSITMCDIKCMCEKIVNAATHVCMKWHNQVTTKKPCDIYEMCVNINIYLYSHVPNLCAKE